MGFNISSFQLAKHYRKHFPSDKSNVF